MDSILKLHVDCIVGFFLKETPTYKFGGFAMYH